ncbi:RNA-directed DNA polymerase, eukaryota, reverse transcriptase zinc-binding domain protein [Tanacetum coccineum]
MADRRSKEDEVNKISMSIFVTNFPDVTTAKDLWNICNQYGKAIDAFIPNRRCKADKRFGFVRFIKIYDVDCLVNNLCTIWIGRLKLQANIAKFDRLPLHRGTHQPKAKVVNTSSSGGPHYEFGTFRHSNSNVQMAKKGHQTHSMANDLKLALVLDDDCVFDSDLSLSVFGKLKEFDSLPNIKDVLTMEGFDDIAIRYMGGYWILLQFLSKSTKDKFMTHVGVSSWFTKLQHTSNDFKIDKRVTWIDIKGKIFWIHAKEVTGWTPDFNNCEEALTNTDEDAQSVKGEDILKNDILKVDSEVEEIPETIFELDDKGDNKSIDDKGNFSVSTEDVQSTDPFNLYDILNKKQHVTVEVSQSHEEPKYPPGFTPRHTSKVNSNVEPNSSRGVNEHIKNSHDTVKEPSVMKKVPNSNSKRDVDVSTSSGHFKSVGAPKSSGSILVLMEYLINVGQTIGLAQKAKKDWVKELCLKNKVNLLSLQETKMEQVNLLHIKTCWGNFLAFDFVVSLLAYVPNDRNLLIISVYAPQELSEKKMLWNYLNHMIDRWKGDVIVMGDFNEVRCQEERFGSIFNPQKSLTLDRFLSDHRPILLCESNFDYGPTPFCFYHSWFEIVNFDSYMEDTWRNINCSNTNPMLRMVIKLKLLKREIHKGDVSPVILEERDENSKYFHGIINKQRNNLAIRGILFDGAWIEDPKVVKNEFFSHFIVSQSHEEPKYPPGFTPRHTSEVNSNVEPNSSRGVNEHIKNSHDTVKEPSVMQKVPNSNSKRDVDVSTSSGHFKSVGAPKSSGSILVLMEYLINVGQTIGLAQKAKKDWVKELCLKNKVNLLSLQETKMEQVNLFHIKSCWGNLAFDFVVSPSVGNSGGILCVWDPKMFHKENSTVSDYFIAITGKWVPNDRNLLIISVYAPQELSGKKDALELLEPYDQ